MKKRILCFGDSNTYGASVEKDIARYDEHTRWPMLLGKKLGPDYTVIEEGFGGRTTVFDDPVEGGYKSGANYLPPCLMSHNPLDIVVLMLGTNDTKERFSMNAFTIAQCAGELITLIRQYGANAENKPPKILLISPIEVGDWLMTTDMGLIFGPKSIEISRGFATQFARVAKERECDFLDAASVAKPAFEDAIHLSREGHAHLAEAVCVKLLTM